ncbi:MAG: hypothetical protein GDA67_15325 [Nitrospira sp. CR1.3]|nr:hypothetical protein [Nitrospira sp. CR1.3]
MPYRSSKQFVGMVAVAALGFYGSRAWAVDPPCNRYQPAKQSRCAEIWRELNKEDGPSIARFGLDQQKRRDAGQINAEQHLAENMQFIKQSTERRLERLKDRMSKE